MRYVLNNERRHVFQRGLRCEASWIDPFSSGRYFDGWRGVKVRPPPEEERPVAPAATWLLAEGWRRRGLVEVDAVPGPRRRARR